VRDKKKFALSSRKRSLVINLDIMANSKALQNMINMVQKISLELAFMGISKEDAGSGKPGSAMEQVPQCNDVGAVIARLKVLFMALLQ
jgi:hypothetical protein